MSDQAVVLLTGASRGLGAAAARWLARRGSRLILTARSTSDLEAVATDVRAAGGEALVVAGDLGDADFCRQLAARALEGFSGRLDALINNAGMIEPIGSFANLDPAQWKRNQDINLLAPLYLARYTAAALKAARGRIINVSTGAAVHPISGWSAYCASKAALMHLTRTMAVEEPDIISVSLRPGVIDTEMQAVIRRDGPARMPAELISYFEQLKSQNRLEPPEVPGKALAWLALHAPATMNGEMVEYTDPAVVEGATQVFGS